MVRQVVAVVGRLLKVGSLVDGLEVKAQFEGRTIAERNLEIGRRHGEADVFENLG